MDEIRDIQKQATPAFIDAPVRTQAFGRNSAAERGYRRAEKIVAALHLVTNHVSTEEPARAALRRAGLNLLSNMLALRDEMRSAESGGFKDALATIRQSISLVRILSVSGYVSAQNTSVLVEALDELGNFLGASQRTNLSESVVLSKDEFLNVGGDRVKDIKDRSEQTDSISNRTVNRTQRTSVSSDTRASGIKDILRAQGQLGIKEVAASLPEYSEKMIQRELARLVEVGEVKKEGSKRWSTYTLAK